MKIDTHKNKTLNMSKSMQIRTYTFGTRNKIKCMDTGLRTCPKRHQNKTCVLGNTTQYKA